VTAEVLGDRDTFQYYLSMIDYPTDLTTIKEKIKDGLYKNVAQWRMDVETMFKNCKVFNEEGSDIHQSAVKLERFYLSELRDYGLIENSSKTIRIH
jgi:Bromodomain